MIIARSHRHHVAQAIRNIKLARAIISPSGHRPIAHERQTVILAPSHRHHGGQVSKHIGLAKGIVSPSQNLLANSKYLVRSLSHPHAVCRYQTEVVTLILDQTGDPICKTNHSCPTSRYGCRICMFIRRVRSPLEPGRCRQIIGVHHSSQHGACTGHLCGWLSRDIGPGEDKADPDCGWSRVNHSVICDKLEGWIRNVIRDADCGLKNHSPI